MSSNNKALSLTDKQLIHRLHTDHTLTQSEIADIVGCSQKTVSKVLRQGIAAIVSEVSVTDVYLLPDNGCYRTSWVNTDEGLDVFQQSVCDYSDPTFDMVADMEEEEPPE